VVPRHDFIGQTIGKINFRQAYGVNIIAIQKRVPRVTPEGKNAFQIQINDLPKPTDVIEEDDVLVVVGSDENIERLARADQ
jgi:trk system potassium uptake protein TrkA